MADDRYIRVTPFTRRYDAHVQRLQELATPKARAEYLQQVSRDDGRLIAKMLADEAAKLNHQRRAPTP